MDIRNIALEKDNNDDLKTFKSKFLNNSNEIYLDGNSLGKLPLKSIENLNEVINKQWGQNLIRSWNDNWLKLTEKINFKMSKLINLDHKEVLIGESTSVNLYKILFSLLNSGQFKKNLVTDCLNFPSDIYIIEGLKEHTETKEIIIINYDNTLGCDINILKKSIQENPGIYCLSLVTYKNSFLYPIKELNEFAEKNKSIIVWDLSHAAGVVNIDFKKTKTLIALGCTYKFLNGGPGSPGYLYVNNLLIKSIRNPINGWFGHSNPFSFSKHFDQDTGIKKFSNGTPHILSLSTLKSSLDITISASTKKLENKSHKLFHFFESIYKEKLSDKKFKLITKNNRDESGSHISLHHNEAWRISQCLISPIRNTSIKIIVKNYKEKCL